MSLSCRRCRYRVLKFRVTLLDSHSVLDSVAPLHEQSWASCRLRRPTHPVPQQPRGGTECGVFAIDYVCQLITLGSAEPIQSVVGSCTWLLCTSFAPNARTNAHCSNSSAHLLSADNVGLRCLRNPLISRVLSWNGALPLLRNQEETTWEMRTTCSARAQNQTDEQTATAHRFP